MGIVTVLWSLAAGVSITLAVAGAFVWATERRNYASAAVTLLGLATAAAAYLELWMMHAATPAEYGWLLRWYHVAGFFAIIGQLLFIHYYLGTGRWWLFCTIVVGRLVVLAVNFTVQPNFNFSSIAALRHFSFLGQDITVIGAAVPRVEWQRFAILTLFLAMAYITDAVVRCWRSGGKDAKRKALAVGLGIGVPLLWTILYTQAIIFGVFRGPVSSVPWYLGALCTAAYEIARDYTLSRRAVQELAELQRQLIRLQMANILGQLSSALAHELSQPLAASLLNIEVALASLDNKTSRPEELRDVLTDSRSSMRRAADIISQMRQLFKNRSVNMQPIRLEDVVRDTLTLIDLDARAKNVTLSVSMPPDLPRVLGNRADLSQVLLNLLTNSIHALQNCPPDARDVIIEARAGNEKREVEVTVRDTGQGVPDSIADKLFAPFFTTKAEGMGMGLALSRTIIEAHGGRLWAERAAGQEGAIFRFTLQRA